MYVGVMFALLGVSCGKTDRSLTEDDPVDETVAIFRFEDGKQVIYCGKLHSHRLKKLCSGDYPSVSPSGRFVAYNPIQDAVHRNPAIQPIEVIEVQTGRVTSFPSIPRDLTPWPESFWSSDEKLIAFEVHDFDGNRTRCVVSMVDRAYWRGTDAEFGARHADAFGSTALQARHSADGRLFVENFQRVGALFFRPDNGKPKRVTAEDMGVPPSPMWIDRTREALFVGRRVSSPYREEDVSDGAVYLIRPEEKDWANASVIEWNAAMIASGEQVSCSLSSHASLH